MLFTVLKAFGLDVPARVEELRTRIEQRVEDASDQAKRVVVQAVVTGVLALCAAMTAAAALAIGLVALFRWVADNLGVFAGYGVIGGVLLLATAILGAAIWARSRPSPQPTATKGEGGPDRGHAPGPARAWQQAAESQAARSAAGARPVSAAIGPEARAQTSSTSASPGAADTSIGEWGSLLGFFLPLLMKSPKSGSIVVDALLGMLRPGGRNTAGAALARATKLVREGNRTHLLGTVAGAIFFGWLLSRRSRQWPAPAWNKRSKPVEQNNSESAGQGAREWQARSAAAADAEARVKETAGAAGADALSSAGSLVQSLRGEIKGIQDLLTKFAVEYGRDAASSARSAAATAAARVGDIAGDLAKSGANVAAAAGEQAKSAATDVEGMARRKPLGIIAGAIVIGVLIGTFGRRR